MEWITTETLVALLTVARCLPWIEQELPLALHAEGETEAS